MKKKQLEDIEEYVAKSLLYAFLAYMEIKYGTGKEKEEEFKRRRKKKVK